MSEHVANEVTLMEEELAYEDAKHGYWQARIVYDDTVEALALWKANHKALVLQPLNPELLQLKKKVIESNNARNNALRKWIDYIAKRNESRPRKMHQIQEKDRVKLPYWSEWNAIAQELNLETSGKLVAGPKTFFCTSCLNGLFIRQEYVDVAKIIATKFASIDSINRVLVVGSPGIGKSMFGIILFLLAIKEKNDVAYRALNGKTHYFTWNKIQYDITIFPVVGKKYVGYFDGNDSGDSLDYNKFDRVFLFASPSNCNYHQFIKEGCFTVYMNPWNKQECTTFAELCSFGNEEWLRKFEVAGGKPRMTFSSCYEYDTLIHRVRKAIPCDLDDLKEIFLLYDQGVFKQGMNHLVFDLYRDDDNPSIFRLKFSSSFVGYAIINRFHAGSVDEIPECLGLQI